MPSNEQAHLDLDGAWPRDCLPEAHYVEAREWGATLRYSATREGMREFEEFARAGPEPFLLLGSGDYHHLSALWVRRMTAPFTLVSFDNHPDWDTRPPHWCCGTWINRALETPLLQRVVVWGCGNFELERPSSFFLNHGALRAGRLAARPWAERLKERTRGRWPSLTREAWRAEMSAFAEGLAGEQVYVTVDLDCLRPEESATNWENGLFTAEEVAWGLWEIRKHAALARGDVCGAYSVPRYARFWQGVAGRMDRPKLPEPTREEALAKNLRALRIIWPALTGRD